MSKEQTDWVMVPREPTDAMHAAGIKAMSEDLRDGEIPVVPRIFAAMLFASPQPPVPPGSGVRVKPLEWIEGKKRDSLGNRWWRGLGVFDHASYRIHHDRDEGGINYVLEGANVAYLHLEDAQAAAQADYDKRIISALEPAPGVADCIAELERQKLLYLPGGPRDVKGALDIGINALRALLNGGSHDE